MTTDDRVPSMQERLAERKERAYEQAVANRQHMLKPPFPQVVVDAVGPKWAYRLPDRVAAFRDLVVLPDGTTKGLTRTAAWAATEAYGAEIFVTTAYDYRGWRKRHREGFHIWVAVDIDNRMAELAAAAAASLNPTDIRIQELYAQHYQQLRQD